jgi:hypothetical protein
MKKAFTILLSVIALASCDVDALIKQIEEPVVEKTTLTILNLPENTTGENLKQLSIGNVALCDNPAESVFDGAAALVPLVAPDGSRFSKSGVYMIRLTLENPDKTLLQLNGAPVEFENGYGTLDLSKIEQDEEPPRGLAILNLPPNTINASFKNLTIGNTAKSADFTKLEINGGSTVVPLRLNNGNGEFMKTGIYIVSLTLDVDSLTRLEIKPEDKVAVEFIDGNGVLDLADYGDAFLAVRFLTILNLPENTEIDSFQSVNIGDIAKAMMDEIKIDGAAAALPITLNNGKEFNKTGTYFVTLRVIVDSLNDIDITKDDYVMVRFENGNGTLDLLNLYGYLGKGYLDGDITNRTNFLEAQVKKETRFEMNGFFYRVVTQAPMDNLYQYSSLPNTTAYIYAVEADGNVVDYKYAATMKNADDFIRFRLSTAKPVYNAEKCGWYSGNDRALWKFIKIGGEWRWKTDVSENFKVENQILASPIGNILYKWENTDISPAQVILESGVYCFEVAGAGGGDSAGYKGAKDASSSYYTVEVSYSKEFDTKGGEGGKIIELISIDTYKQLTVYTGKAGSAPNSEPVKMGAVFNDQWTLPLGGAVSGGGGGCGSFISYDLGLPNDYFLCAGGGAGASGIVRLKYSAYPQSYIYNLSLSAGGYGGGADKGGDGGGLAKVVITNLTYNSLNNAAGTGMLMSKPVYSLSVYDKIPGGGISGIGNTRLFGKTEDIANNYTGIETLDSGISISVLLKSESNKELLTENISTIGIGGKPASLDPPGYDKTLKPEDLAGGSGGNNRDSVRGGNSGGGYVRIYSLN